MEDLKQAYKDKSAEMRQKYEHQIYAIAITNKVDMGVAFDMLKANGRGAYYPYVNKEELDNDVRELTEISKKILEG